MRSAPIVAPVTVRKLFRVSATSPSPRARARARYTAAGARASERASDRRDAHERRDVRSLRAGHGARVCTGRRRRARWAPAGPAARTALFVRARSLRAVIGAVGTCFRTARDDLGRCR